jgi:hypothetical protein
VTTQAYVDAAQIARDTIKEIGYVHPDIGFDYHSCGVLSDIHSQSPDIARAVDKAEDNEKEQGAGDQGLMFGYATNETDMFKPLPIHLAQARLRAAEEGLPVIRSTPTGISAVIDATGQVRNYVRWKATGVIDAAIPPSATRLTAFARLGNVIPLAIGFVLLILAIVLEKRGRYRTDI